MDDLRLVLTVNKDINETMSKWLYGPTLTGTQGDKSDIMEACIFSLKNKTYESGLAKLLRDPTFELHVCLDDVCL